MMVCRARGAHHSQPPKYATSAMQYETIVDPGAATALLKNVASAVVSRLPHACQRVRTCWTAPHMGYKLSTPRHAG